MSAYIYDIVQTAAREKSFLRTAELHNLSPSAVSHAIANLENSLGFTLFSRNRSGVQLTRNGEVLLPYIKAVVQSEERFWQEASEIRGVQKGTVRLGVFRSVMIHWIPALVNSFRALYPSIEIIIMQGGYPELISWLKAGMLDLAFLSVDTAKGMAEKVLLHRDRLICIVPKDFTPRNPGYVCIEDISENKIINQRSGEDVEQSIYFRQQGVNYSSQFFISDDDAIIAMVESGFGIAIMPALVLGNNTRRVDVYPIEPPGYRTICLVSPDPKNDAPSTKKMRDHIVSHVRMSGLYNLED